MRACSYPTIPLFIALTLLLGSSLAAAQSSPPPASPPPTAANSDVVVLRSGRTVRGHVVLLIPQQNVVIEDETGQRETVAWVSIVTANGPSFAGQGLTAPPPVGRMEEHYVPIVPDEMFDTPQPGRVPLVIVSAGEPLLVGLYLGDVAPARVAYGGYGSTLGMGSEQYQDRLLCRTPCTLYVPPGRFGITTRGQHMGAQRQLIEVAPRGTRYLVQPPTRRTRTAGVVVVAGGAAMGLGAILLVSGLVMFATSPHTQDFVSLTALGGTAMGLGVAALIVGIMLRRSERPSPSAGAPQVRYSPRWRLDGGLGASGAMVSASMAF